MQIKQHGDTPDNRRLLVIDDNPTILADFRKILAGGAATARSGQRRKTLKSIESEILGKPEAPESPGMLLQGFELDTAERGQDGLAMLAAALAQGKPYALAFVDMRMPNGWDGVETIEQLWRVDPRLQVVICTAYSDHSWEQTVTRLGANDSLLFLKKPFDDVEICQLACALTRKWTAVETAKRQLLALQASEAEARKLSLVASRTHNGVVITGADGRIQWVNEGFERISGFSLSEVVGKTPGSFLQGPESDKATVKLMRDAISKGEGFNIEILNYRKDGSKYWLNVEAQPIRDDQGRLTNFMAIESDITVRRQAADDLAKARDAAEAANRAKGEFLANISHEIRTPMTAIIGYSDLMIQAGPNDSHLREWAIQTQRNADYLLSLLNDILDFSKIEAGRVRIAMQPCSVAELVSAVTGLLAPQAAEKGIALRRTYLTPIPESIESDPVRLRQILTNILSNAVKFTSKGSVDLNVGLGTSQGRPVLEFEVVDTGIGMPPERIPQLFTPFTQVYDRNMLRQFNGSGLGLAISQALAGMLGGSIDVSSQMGIGSRFTVRLPLSSQDMAGPMLDLVATNLDGAQDRSDRQRDVPSFAGRRILLTDDNPDNRIIIEFLLARTDAGVQTATNGQECVDQVLEGEQSGHPFDIVLLDMSMPVMDGYEAATRLRAAGFKKPIIALTAFALADDHLKCHAAGCDAYLSKPINPPEFYEMISNHLRDLPYANAAIAPIAPAPTPSPAGLDAAPAPSASNPLDLSNDPYMKDLAVRYIASLPDRIKDIQDAWNEKDIRRMRTQVHKLRGTGANFGFAMITQTASECEQAIEEVRPAQEIEASLTKLLDVLKAIGAK